MQRNLDNRKVNDTWSYQIKVFGIQSNTRSNITVTNTCDKWEVKQIWTPENETIIKDMSLFMARKERTTL